MEIKLDALPPFSLSAVVGSHGWVRLAPFNSDDHFSWFSYVAQLETSRILELLVQESPGGVQVSTEVDASAAEYEECGEMIRWMLGLEQDFSTFYALASAEPKLSKISDKAQGRLLRCPTLFEDVVKTIMTTNTSWAGTIRMAQRLVAEFGEPLPSDPTRRAFPTPTQLAKVEEAALREAAGLGYRAPYVAELARSIADGVLDLEALRTTDLPTSELRKQLLAIKGVGAYAAANLLMILGRYDYVPVDSWALKMVSQEWHHGAPVGQAEVEAAFERWGDWKGLAYWFWDWSMSGADQ